jgi:internalin A
MPEESVPTLKRRRRFGLSLRLLMLLVLLLGGGFGWLAYRERVQRRAVVEIEAAGGKVYYGLEWEFGPDKELIARKPRWPKWLVSRVGQDYLGRVIAVHFPSDTTNKADDVLMERIADLTDLEELDLGKYGIGSMVRFARCRVTDNGLGPLRRLPQLRRLHLRETSIKGPGFVHLEAVSGLRELDLQGMQIADADAAYLGKLTGLESLNISSNSLGDAGMAHLAQMTALKRLDLAASLVTSAGFGQLARLPRLDTLFLTVKDIDSYAFLGKLTGISELSIHDNGSSFFSNPYRQGMSTSRPANLGLESLGSMTRLRTLRLSSNDQDTLNRFLSTIDRAQSIDKLTIESFSVLYAPQVEQIIRLGRLKSIELSGVQIETQAVAALSRMTALTELDLGWSSITNDELAYLSGMTSLETLKLDFTKITDTGLVHLLPLTNCKNLSVLQTGVSANGLAAFRNSQATLHNPGQR